jgi:uncharacterized protein with GYD domain
MTSNGPIFLEHVEATPDEAMIKFILMVNKQGQTRLVCRLRLFAVACGEPTAN